MKDRTGAQPGRRVLAPTVLVVALLVLAGCGGTDSVREQAGSPGAADPVANRLPPQAGPSEPQPIASIPDSTTVAHDPVDVAPDGVRVRSGANVNQSSPVGDPTGLRIPSIDVDTPLLRLGIAADGTSQVPDDPQLAGWFTAGPRPGEVGPAVLLGHIDSRTGPAVFARLRELKVGETVLVTSGAGDRTFVVDRSEQVAKDAFPTDEVYGPVPDPSLRLITCGGAFDRSTGHYVDNVIVFLSLAPTVGGSS